MPTYPNSSPGSLSVPRLSIGAANTFQSSATLLELQSQSQGFLPPVMSLTDKSAIATPPEGLVVYDSTSKTLSIYSNGAWTSLQASGQLLAPGITVHTLTDGQTYAPSATPNVVLNGSVSTQTILLPINPVIGQMVTFTQLTGTITTLTISTADGSVIVPTPPTAFAAGNFITYAYVVLGPTHYWVRVAGNV